MRDPTAKRRRRMSDENKPPPPPPQPFRFRSPEELERSLVWQAIKRAYATAERLRERGLLPEFSPEMIEQLRQVQPADDSPVTELARRVHELAREQREQEEEEERSNVGKIVETKGQDSVQVEGTVSTDTAMTAPLVEPSASVVEPPAQQMLEQPSDPPKRRRGAPRKEIPHLDEALADLAQKHLKVYDQVSERHIEFVIKFLRDRGVRLDRNYDEGLCEGGTVKETQQQLIRRRIKEYLDLHPRPQHRP
jgi:hypothetical protein